MQPVPQESSLIGQTLDNGKYRVLRLIGRGGMGEVYEAEHVALEHRVAVKLMLDKFTGDAEAVTRFTREALAATRIGNPHIIQVIDVGTAPDGRAYVIMELLIGAPLSRVLEECGALPPQRAVHIIRQVLRAVGAAHAKGIVHRDLKPDNIFLIEQGEQGDFVKLLDFGISKMIDPDLQAAATRLTTTGVVMGTPLYMAPEQAMGMDIDHLADIYACGVILYEMLAGRPPFDGATYAVLVAKLLTAEPQLLSEARPGLSPKLVAATHRALEKEPKNRFASADAFVAGLPSNQSASAVELAGTVSGGQVSVAQVSIARPVRSAPPTGKRRWPLAAAVIALVAGAATATVIVTSRSQRPAPPPATAAGGVTTAAPASAASAAAPSAAAMDTEASAAPQVTPLPTGRLKVEAQPERVEVFVGGEHKGTTPAELTLPAGSHQVRLELAGYEPSAGAVEIEPNGSASLRWTLTRATPASAKAAKAAKAAKDARTAKDAKAGGTSAPGPTGRHVSELPPTPSPGPPTDRTVDRSPPPPPPPVKTEPKKPPPPPPLGLPTKGNPYGTN